MDKKIPLLLIIASAVLIILNFIFTADKMDLGFWLRTSSSAVLIVAMALIIRKREKQKTADKG